MANSRNNRQSQSQPEPAPVPIPVPLLEAQQAAKVADEKTGPLPPDLTETRKANVNDIRLNDPEKAKAALKAVNILDKADRDANALIAEALTVRAEAKEALLSVKEAAKKADDAAGKTKEKEEGVSALSAIGLSRLYAGVTRRLISRDEANGILIDVFGAKARKDGKPGNTPLGRGLDIRKRLVLLSDAKAIADGANNRPKALTGPERREIAEVVQSFEAGQVSAHTAYDNLTALRSEYLKTTRLDPAFDANKVAAMVRALASADAPDLLRSDPALIDAYRSLRAAINLAFTAPAEEAGE